MILNIQIDDLPLSEIKNQLKLIKNIKNDIKIDNYLDKIK